MRAAVLALALFGVAAVSALDAGRMFRSKALNGESASAATRARVAHIEKLTRGGAISAATAYGLLDQTITRGGFEGFEHGTGSGYGVPNTDADAIKFPFIDALTLVEKQVTTADEVLVSEDGVNFSYSEMTAVAGDYWSVKDSPLNIICNHAAGGRTAATQGTRFAKAFNDMWANPKYGKAGKNIMRQLQDQLRAMLHKERDGIKAVNENSIHRGSEYYENNPGFGILAMAGEWAKVAGFDPRVDGLASADGNIRALAHNDDHFFTCAQDTYHFGHIKAMNDAYAAGKAWTAARADANLKKAAQRALTKAYAEDGFVSHFLSDQFSSGHLRCPRVELRDTCGSVLTSAPMAGLTANVMHDEDNWNCLLVTNQMPGSPKWWSCGDHRFFDQENGMNRRMLRDTIAASVSEVALAFSLGKVNGANPTLAAGFSPVALKMIPTVVGLSAREQLENTCPMFVVSGNNVNIRLDADPTTTLPRPPAARTTNFGSSLRQMMTKTLFPAFASTTLTGAAPTTGLSCGYRAMRSTDCCVPAGRSTPVFAKDPSTFSDKPAKADGSTKNPSNKNLRSTYINTCKITQAITTAEHAVMDKTKEVVKNMENFVIKGVATYAQGGRYGVPFLPPPATEGAALVEAEAVADDEDEAEVEAESEDESEEEAEEEESEESEEEEADE